jgi:SAM-dependent methyltransferase
MFDDVTGLKAFYQTPLGQHLAGQMQPHIANFWQHNATSCNMILGYGVDWLQHNDKDPKALTALMLARCGVIKWPETGAVRSTLVEGQALPLSDVYVDRLLVAHALEFDAEPGRLLDECWRVLDGAGRLLVVVPNRRGLWARREHTPFGHGRPYSSRQLCQLLETHGFIPRHIQRAVCLPPFNNHALMRFASGIERLGRRWWPALGGVLLVEAEKMLYAAAGNTSKLRRRGPGTAPALAVNYPRNERSGETAIGALRRVE